MATQALTIPLDITWQRIGYSEDMVDTDFGDLDFTPKWRSSMAVYAYVVPQEQTAESYPDARIVYLRLTSSITGWNPSEELRSTVNLDDVGDGLDDVQESLWEAIQADGWAKTYWPCLGAIAQVGVYAHHSDEVGPDDFPYILDFEPKKRELYETATETGEFLSASSEQLSVQKGTTTVDGTEKSAKVTAGGAIGPFGAKAEAGIIKSHDTTTVDQRTTDTSREDRETKSFSTNFSQMYQLFNGYHLGTNRALFAVAPRPHIVSNTQFVDFNLIDGERKLEGIQDMFLVIHVPSRLTGICLQASLDTGHDVMTTPGVSYRLRDDDIPGDGGGGGGRPPGDGGGDGGDGGDDGGGEIRQLVVTRRMIRSCALFSEGGRLTPTEVPGQPPDVTLPPIVWEDLVAEVAPRRAMRRLVGGGDSGPRDRAELATEMNIHQRKVVNSMLSGFSAGQYRARPFVETQTFRRLARLTFRNLKLDVDQLATRGYLSPEATARLKRAGLHTVADLFSRDADTTREVDQDQLRTARETLINESVLGARRRGRENEHGG